eukprot:gene3138-3673_t
MGIRGPRWAPLALAAAVWVGRAAAGVAKPHICFILADDWGQYNAGFRGDRAALTPSVDALAAEGRNPMHLGLDPLNWTATVMRPGMGASAVHPNYTFLPRLLQSSGY